MKLQLFLTLLSAAGIPGAVSARPNLRKTSSAASMNETSTNNNFSVRLSEYNFTEYPQGGGATKVLDPTSISNNTMGFAIVELFPGGVRQLHWHPLSAEWAYVFNGTCRITLMNNDAQYVNAIAQEGDFWYFPKSWAHSLQGVDPDLGCTMALFFDAAQSPIFNDLDISEMIGAFPIDVLSENLGTPVSVLESFQQKSLVVNQAEFPPPLFPESKHPLPEWPIFEAADGDCKDAGAGGYILEVRDEIFPATKTMSGAFMRLEEGSLRDIHWHPNADEMHYVLSGSVQVSIYGIGGVRDTYVISAGDVGFVPKGYAHYLEAIGGPTELLLTFNNPSWTTQELSTWMAVTPSYLTAASLNTTADVIDQYFPKSVEYFVGDKFAGCPAARRHRK